MNFRASCALVAKSLHAHLRVANILHISGIRICQRNKGSPGFAVTMSDYCGFQHVLIVVTNPSVLQFDTLLIRDGELSTCLGYNPGYGHLDPMKRFHNADDVQAELIRVNSHSV